MARDLKAKLSKKQGGFIGPLVGAIAAPLLSSLLKGGKGVHHKKHHKKGGAIKSIGSRGGAITNIGSRGGAIKLLGERRGKGLLSTVAKNAIKMGAQFLKNKIQNKVNEKKAQYMKDPMAAIRDAQKGYNTGKDVWNKLKTNGASGSGFTRKKLRTVVVKGKAGRRKKQPIDGIPSTNTTRTTQVAITKKNYKPPKEMSIASLQKKKVM